MTTGNRTPGDLGPNRICTSRAPNSSHGEPCELCGHTTLLHPSRQNPALDACVVCQMIITAPVIGPPPQPIGTTTSVYFVVTAKAGLYGVTVDQDAAYGKAMEIHGLVVEWPATADFRGSERPGDDG